LADKIRVAVIGASGFIGSRLAEYLILNHLAEVRPIVRSFKGMARLARFNVDIAIGDACDEKMLAEVLGSAEVVFHCVVGDRSTIVRSAEAVYRACRSAKVQRLVYLSSAVVHGHNPLPGTNDGSDLIQRQPFEYNVSKVRAEKILRKLRTDGEVEVVTLRPMIVFGPRSAWWTAQIATDMIAGRAYLVDSGNGICNTVFVDNLVHAMWLSATVPEAANQDFIITDGEDVSWRQLYQSVARAVGVQLDFVPSITRQDAVLSIRKSKHEALKEFGNALKPLIARTVWPSVPHFLRQTLKSSLGERLFPITSPKPNELVLDPEIVSLQQCDYRLPVEKAKRILGYKPEFTFSKACVRTEAWLRFALGLDKV